MEAQLFGQIASTGLAGALLVLTLFALRSKDRELKEEMKARIDDAQKFNVLAMSLQKEVIQAVNHLGEILEYLEGSERRKDVRQSSKTDKE